MLITPMIFYMHQSTELTESTGMATQHNCNTSQSGNTTLVSLSSWRRTLLFIDISFRPILFLISEGSKASNNSPTMVSDYVGYLEKGQIPPKYIPSPLSSFFEH